MRKIRYLKFFSEGFRIGAWFMFYMTTLLLVGYMYGLEFAPETELPVPYPFYECSGLSAVITLVCFLMAYAADRAARHFEKQLHPVLEFPDSNVDA